MFDPFASITDDSKRDHRRAYRDYLRERDGELDTDARQLSKREARMQRYRAFSNVRTLDRSLFDAQHAAFDASRATPREMLMLLALVKTNGAEAYGVQAVFEKTLARVRNDGDDTELALLLEEGYHTRILLSSAEIYGVEVRSPYMPPAGLRALIATLGGTPQLVARPLILASELLGTMLFARLLERVGEVFAHDPEVRDALEERVIEVLVDEIGHVSYNRLWLGKLGLMQARAMLPVVAKGMADIVPEFGLLDLRPNADLRVLEQLPHEVVRQAFMV